MHKESKILLSVLLSLNFVSCSPSIPTIPHENPTSSVSREPKIPELGRWEARMGQLGKKIGVSLDPTGPFDPQLASVYYDGEWVFLQIAEYTHDNSWLEFANRARAIYRDRYVLPNDGRIPGFWNFTNGLTEDYRRTKDELSRKAVLLIAQNGAFVRDNTPEDTRSTELSREVAYGIIALINAEKLGGPRRSRLSKLVDDALSHIDQWFVKHSAPFMRSFMVALTCQALIQYDDYKPDPRVLAAVRLAADSLWKDMWNPSMQAFKYSDRPWNGEGTDPTADLNLLIAPVYGWLYHQTGEEKYAEEGDRVFAGGVRGAWIEDAKHFNQNYRWSIAYVKWRQDKPIYRK